MSWIGDFLRSTFGGVKPKHVAGAAGIAAATAVPVAVVNYTFPHLTVSEGLALVSYYDPWGHVWTDCIGNTKGAGPGMHFTAQECLQQTANRLPDYWLPMVAAAPVLGTDALPVSFRSAWLQFTWNEGTGTFARYIAPAINAASSPADYRQVCQLMFHFTRAGNDPTLLLPRRKREFADCVTDL